MPEARWEWLVFSVGIAVTVALVALMVVDGGGKGTKASPAALTRRTTTAPPARTTTAARPTTTAPETTTSPATTTAPVTTTTTTTAPATPAAVRLRLTARADTWLSVRTPAKRVLYEGTLPAGKSRTFSGDRFEVRFGAAANVSATLNGKPLSLPGGTYSVTVGEGGLGPRSA
jgi:hypothetical protein